MDSNHSAQIQALRKGRYIPDWIKVPGIIDVALTSLKRSSCTSITFLGSGTFKVAFKLDFADGDSAVAAVSKEFEDDGNPMAFEAEVATMQFIRRSGLYPGVRVPDVYAWDGGYTNATGAPYILMEFLRGVHLDDVCQRGVLRGLDALEPEDQVRVVDAVARLQAMLQVPVPFSQIGSLQFGPEGRVEVGPFTLWIDDTYDQRIMGGPYKDMLTMWRDYTNKTIMQALTLWHSLDADRFPWMIRREPFSPRRVMDNASTLASLLPYFALPPHFSRLVLQHPDLSLRNILFDPEDYTKIVGVLDWTDARIVPLLLGVPFPEALFSVGHSPFKRYGFPNEGWYQVPNDWVCSGKKSNWPSSLREENTLWVSTAIRRYYLRQQFVVCYSKHVQEKSASDIARALLPLDAQYYIKFHEVIRGGYTRWAEAESWIKETYARLVHLRPKPGTFLVGPNTYQGSSERPLFDLESFETPDILTARDLNQQLVEQMSDNEEDLID